MECLLHGGIDRASCQEGKCADLTHRPARRVRHFETGSSFPDQHQSCHIVRLSGILYLFYHLLQLILQHYDANGEQRKEMQEKDDGDEPIALTVKIGEDTILDKIIGGINDRSFMNNMGVIGV